MIESGTTTGVATPEEQEEQKIETPEKAREILERAGKQRLEKKTEERLGARNKEKFEESREKYGRVLGTFAGLGVLGFIKLERLISNKEREEAQAEILQENNLILENEKRLVMELFRASKEELTEEQQKERHLFEKISQNQFVLKRWLETDHAQKILNSRIFGGLTLAAFIAGMGKIISNREARQLAIALLGSTGAGVAVGGLVGGLRAYNRAKKELYGAENWSKEIEGKSNLDLVEIIAALETGIQKAKIKGNESEALSLVAKLREARYQFESSRKPEAKTEEKRAENIQKGTDDRSLVDQENPILDKRGREIFNLLWKEKRGKVTRKVIGGVVTGALIGGAAAIVFHALTHFKSETAYTHEGCATHGETTVQTAKHLETLQKEVSEQANPLPQGHFEKLATQEFVVKVERGEGLTHLARKAINEYLTMENGSDPQNFNPPERAQLIYAEDWLRRQIEHPGALRVGEEFKIDGQDIRQAIEKAGWLKSEQIHNLHASWVPRVSRENWTKMEDFGEWTSDGKFKAGFIHPENEVTFRGILQSEQAKPSAEKLEQQAQKAVKKLETVLQQTTPTEKTGTTKIVTGVVLGLLGVAGYINREKLIKFTQKGFAALKEIGKKKKAEVSTESKETEGAPESAETPEEETEKYSLTRKAAQITLVRAENWQDLWAETEQKGDEIFRQKTRNLWKELAVHGRFGQDKEGKSVILNHTDLDGKTALGLLKLAGISTKNVEYIAPGKYVQGKINLDTGDRHGVVIEDEGKTAFFDHHTEKSGRATSATKITYEVLTGLGLLPKQEYLDQLVEFVTHVDNKTFPEEEKYFKDSDRMLLGLQRFIKFKHLHRFFEQGKNPIAVLSDEELKQFALTGRNQEQKALIEKSWQEMERMEQNGLILDSERYGRIAVDIDKKIPGGLDAAKAYGCGAYLIWNPQKNNFFISAVRPLTDRFEQGINVRGTMWLKPRNGEPLELDLRGVLEKLTDNKLQPTGELKEYLEREAGASKETEIRIGQVFEKKDERHLYRGNYQITKPDGLSENVFMAEKIGDSTIKIVVTLEDLKNEDVWQKVAESEEEYSQKSAA